MVQAPVRFRVTVRFRHRSGSGSCEVRFRVTVRFRLRTYSGSCEVQGHDQVQAQERFRVM